jgi:UDP-N-acetyl-D-mannosaminuronic acid dehydrogenase
MNKSVSVIGLGFIGLPLALSYCEKGFKVIGVDIDANKVEALRRGYTEVLEEYNGEPLSSVLARHVSTGSFVPTDRVAVAAWETNTYLVTVGIPVSADGTLNEVPIIQAMEQLGRVIKPNDLVIIRSTVVPGMVEEKLIPALERTSRLLAGVDFRLAYASERVAEGRAMYEFQTLDIVVGGVTEACAQAAANLLSQLTSGAIHVTDLRTAQAVKVIENVQRDVNIALVQEFATFAELHGIDVYELIRLANTHPRVNLLQPGIGVGGYCIPNAYRYLRASLPSEDVLTLIPLARKINADTPDRIIHSLETKLAAEGKSLQSSVIAILGLGMKDNSNDLRNSPAVDLAERLLRRGAVVRAYDPLVSLQFPFQTKTLKEALYGADGLVVAAWHDVFLQMDIVDALQTSRVRGAIVDLKKRLAPYLRWLDMQVDESRAHRKVYGASR